jgi:hypothetical protein
VALPRVVGDRPVGVAADLLSQLHSGRAGPDDHHDAEPVEDGHQQAQAPPDLTMATDQELTAGLLKDCPCQRALVRP